MIHVLTVHHHSDRWIDIQLSYLSRHMSAPYRTWANLEGVEQRRDAFDRVIPALGDHPGKLNLLAMEATAEADDDDDLLMFLDGDAFPIRDPLPTITSALASADMVAVQRTENLNDPQPHPCFAVCTVKGWQSFHGDWSAGHPWPNDRWGTMTDTGGNLLRLLELHEATWTPLLRSNRTNIHPLWYAVYADIVYHHGAGFRAPISRFDAAGQPTPLLPYIADRRFAGKPIRRWNRHRSERWSASLQDAARAQSESIYEEIQHNPRFYERFVNPADDGDAT